MDKILINKKNLDQENATLADHLLFLHKDFEKDLLFLIHSKKFSDITMADLQILHSITSKGSYASDIAKLAGITKQAVAKSVSSLTKRKYLIQSIIEKDTRIKLLLLTKKGEKVLEEARLAIKTIETNYENCLGKFILVQLKTNLRKLLALHPIRK